MGGPGVSGSSDERSSRSRGDLSEGDEIERRLMALSIIFGGLDDTDSFVA